MKVGDKVKILDRMGSSREIGDVGTVVEMQNTNSITVEFDGGVKYYFTPCTVEVVEEFDDKTFKIPLSDSYSFTSEELRNDKLEREISKLLPPEKKVGIKHDTGKAPISLIPVEAILGEADVFNFGAKKYGRHNFRYGMEHTRVLDAAMRHILAIMNGEDTDPESGMPHWAHARCCLAMYAYYQTNQVGNDDRFKKES